MIDAFESLAHSGQYVALIAIVFGVVLFADRLLHRDGEGRDFALEVLYAGAATYLWLAALRSFLRGDQAAGLTQSTEATVITALWWLFRRRRHKRGKSALAVLGFKDLALKAKLLGRLRRLKQRLPRLRPQPPARNPT